MPKTGGRQPGSRNKRTIEAESYFRAIMERPEFQQQIDAVLTANTPNVGFLQTVWAYVHGKPIDVKQVIELTRVDEHGRRIRRVFVVVDDQHSLFELAFIGAPLGRRDHLRPRERQLDHELATPPVSFTAAVETSGVKFHKPPREREANAQSRARGARLSLREEVEHTRQQRRRNPDS